MFTFPFDATLQRLEPLFVRDGEIFVKTRQDHGEATLVTAQGVAHPLRRLCTARTWQQHMLRLNRPLLREQLAQERAQRSPSGETGALRYFVEYLAPSFQARDWDEGYRDEAAPASAPTQAAPEPGDWAAEIAALVENVPLPEVPSPSFWLFGRVWGLAARATAPTALHVRFGQEILGLTGDYVLAQKLETQWKQRCQALVATLAQRLVDRAQTGPVPPHLQQALDEIARCGAYEHGDLLFLSGRPPRLGHVLPSHYNRILGRQTNRDLAVVALLQLPPSISHPTVYQRNCAGRWEPCPLPNGLCLGGGPPEDRPTTPGLALAAYLRWAALRIAANGKFHASDN